MSIFRVKRDYLNGMWIKNHPNPVVEVMAVDAKNAAEIVCGEVDPGRGTRDRRS